MLPSIKQRRRLLVESLESRYALDGQAPWANAEGLTLSFPADGTRVGDQVNSLQAVMSAAGVPNWQELTARAFQTWAQYANINVGVVADGGQPLGVRGLSHGDSRFGDIRVVALPLSLETYGEAIPNEREIGGTWAGDLLFNSRSPWGSAADFFSVALHEAGHVLGLEHSLDPASPMFAHGVAQTSGPTAVDIAALRALYGARGPDSHDAKAPNNTIDRATQIPHVTANDGFDGSRPAIAFGDIQDASDHDFLKLPILSGYRGPLTLEVQTKGLSLSVPRLRVYDKRGELLGTAVVQQTLGGSARLTLPIAPDERIFLEVDAPGGGLLTAGTYAVIARYDSLLALTDSQTQAMVLAGGRWNALADPVEAAELDLRKVDPTNPSPQLEDDGHSDDGVGSSRRLEPVVDTPNRLRFQRVGAISDFMDQDLLRVRSPHETSAGQALTVLVEAWETGGIVPDVSILDHTGAIVPATVLSNGQGQVQIRSTGIEANKDYFVQVRSRNGLKGDYNATIDFDFSTQSRTAVFSQSLTFQQPQRSSTLYVARTQLFSFALQSTASADLAPVPIWMEVKSVSGELKLFVGSGVGEFRSSQGVTLDPGQYEISVRWAPADASLGAVAFTVFADSISEPAGPPIIAVGQTPIYDCPDLAGMFCFPNQPATSAPVLVVPNLPTTATPLPEPVTLPADQWFWSPEYLPTNPVDGNDVNGDGYVTGLDALIIADFLNLHGFGPVPSAPRQRYYLDVNGDGYVTGLDAIIVVNQLISK